HPSRAAALIRCSIPWSSALSVLYSSIAAPLLPGRILSFRFLPRHSSRRGPEVPPCAPSRDASEPVQIPELSAQVGQVRLRVQRSPVHAQSELLWEELAPVPVDLFAQPVEESGELACGHAGVEVGEGCPEGGEDLGAHDVAEGVGREVTDRTARPM